MPRELRSKEEVEKLLPSAREIRLVKGKEGVKLKLRGKEMLYIFKTSEGEAEALLKGAKVDVVEY